MLDQLNEKYELSWRSHVVGEQTFRLLQLVDFERTVDKLIDELVVAGETDLVPEDCPYFGQIYTCARHLSEIVDRLDLIDKKVLELGCGLALPSFVATSRGADCTALDIHPDVEDFLLANMAENQTTGPIHFQKVDWRTVSLPQRFDYIIGSDILYEKDHPHDVARFLHRHLDVEGMAIIIDPCRWHHLEFVQTLKTHGLQVQGDYSFDEEDGNITKIFTMRIQR